LAVIMSKSLNLAKPISSAIRDLARKTVTAAAGDLARAAEPGRVHAARRNLKRLRSLLRMIRPAIGKRAARDADGKLKSAADLLAGARRMDALKLAATKLALGQDESGRLVAAIAEHFGHHHETRALADQAGEARALVLDLRAGVKAWRLPHRDRSFCLAGMKKCYASARSGLAQALASGGVEELHEARKHVIHNLHHLDLLHRLWPGMFEVWIAELTILREALGDFNDLAELRQIAESMAAADAILAAIDAPCGELLAVAGAKARVLYAEKPAAFARRIGAMWDRIGD
jgi:CHAD domain-containing protein